MAKIHVFLLQEKKKGCSKEDGLFHIDIGSNVPCERDHALQNGIC
jgi:hypothetical protein